LRVKQSTLSRANRSVLISIAVNLGEALLLGFAAWLTHSAGLRAQTADNVSDLAVCIFLLFGVLSGTRKSDDSHPLGYGRERFFWSLFAALGIFIGGAGLALDGAVRSALDPSPVADYPTAYLALLVTLLLDLIALFVSFRPLRVSALERGLSVRDHLLRNSDPVLTTMVVSGACAVVGGLIAALGLLLSQISGRSWPDTIASAIVGLLLLATSVFLLRANRELLTGRGVAPSMIQEMRKLISSQVGIQNVPDLFGVVVGPSSLIVDGDITLSDELTVNQVEAAILICSDALRKRWPSIEFVYLTPVAVARPRRVVRPLREAASE
jgi:cation diffusion facilitator family transporter